MSSPGLVIRVNGQWSLSSIAYACPTLFRGTLHRLRVQPIVICLSVDLLIFIYAHPLCPAINLPIAPRPSLYSWISNPGFVATAKGDEGAANVGKRANLNIPLLVATTQQRIAFVISHAFRFLSFPFFSFFLYYIPTTPFSSHHFA